MNLEKANLKIKRRQKEDPELETSKNNPLAIAQFVNHNLQGTTKLLSLKQQVRMYFLQTMTFPWIFQSTCNPTYQIFILLTQNPKTALCVLYYSYQQEG